MKFDIEKDRDKIKAINENISGALDSWSDILLHANADEWAYYLNFNDDDLFNAIHIFIAVWQNVAIKSGYYTETGDDIPKKMEAFTTGVKEGFGIDTAELAKKIFGKNGKSGETER